MLLSQKEKQKNIIGFITCIEKLRYNRDLNPQISDFRDLHNFPARIVWLLNPIGSWNLLQFNESIYINKIE